MSFILLENPNVEIIVSHAVTGKILQRQAVRNKVVATGRNVMRDLILGVGPSPNYIAFGTGTEAVTDADDELGAEVWRDPCTTRKTRDIEAIYILHVSPWNANDTGTWTEVGLFANSGYETAMRYSGPGEGELQTCPSRGGILVARARISPLEKTKFKAVVVTWAISIARG